MDPPSGTARWPQQHVVLRDVVAMLFRRKWLILGTTALIISLAAAYSYTRVETYSAKAEVLVSAVLRPLDSTDAKSTSAETETRVATSLAVAEIARAALSSPLEGDALAKHATADMSQGSLILSLSYSAETPDEAAKGANAFANAYLSYREGLAAHSVQQKSESLAGELRSVNETIKAINAKIASQSSNSQDIADLQSKVVVLQASSVALQNQLVAVSSLTTHAGEVIEAASPPTSPASPRHTLDLVVGAFIGLILAVMLALVLDGPRHPLRYPDALEDVIGAPVLASIPKVRRRRATAIVTGDPRSHAAHAYRTLRIALLARCSGSGIKTILVTSANAGDGKTATAANLAAALAELGKHVVLVSADLRRPQLDRAFGLERAAGLAEVLQEEVEPLEAIYETRVPNLLVVPSGVSPTNADPANLLQSERMSEMLATCRSADYVILDSPPILEVSDATVLAQISDAILFVADGKRTDGVAVSFARQHLESTRTPIIGAVMIRAEIAFSDLRRRDVAAHVPPTNVPTELSNGRLGHEGTPDASAWVARGQA